MMTRHDRMKQRVEEALLSAPLPTTVPKFATEAEEATWWEANQDGLAARFQQAADTGTLGRGTVARRAAEIIPAAEAPAPPRRRRRGRPATAQPEPPKSDGNPFVIARDAASTRLQQAHGEKQEHTAALATLDLEIPRLQQAVQALEYLLNPTMTTLHRMSDPAKAMRAANREGDHVISAGVPDEVDDRFAGMASIPATHSQDGQELAPDIDSIPGVGGDGFV